ncbi:hypothetical protein LINGRAHAP2_LOCUS2736 [Linum grandiflorum]
MFRCGSLRRYGAEVGELGLGVGLTLKPCLVRVMVIVQKLGLSWSSIYYANYNLSGYQLASPILALTAYDYNATTSIDNNSSYYYPYSSKPITIKFSTATSCSNNHHNVYLCAIFAKDGTVRLNPPISISPPQVCVSTVDGHYGLVVKLSSAERGKKMLRLALGGLIGVICLSLLLLIVGLSVKKVRGSARMGELESNADSDVYVPVAVIGNIRVPVAGFTRTAPTLENEDTFY